MPRIQIWHLVVLIIAFIVLFGWKNLPNIARSMGESMRVFKTEVDQMKDENAARKDKDKNGAPPLPEGEGGTTATGTREHPGVDAAGQPLNPDRDQDHPRA